MVNLYTTKTRIRYYYQPFLLLSVSGTSITRGIKLNLDLHVCSIVTKQSGNPENCGVYTNIDQSFFTICRPLPFASPPLVMLEMSVSIPFATEFSVFISVLFKISPGGEKICLKIHARVHIVFCIKNNTGVVV